MHRNERQAAASEAAMDIDLRRGPPTAQHIEAVREEEIETQDLAWSSGSSLVLLAQATVLGMTAAVLGWALGEMVNEQDGSVEVGAALVGLIAAVVFWWSGWWSLKREAEQSRQYVNECLVAADGPMLASLAGYVRRKAQAEAYVEMVRLQGRPVMSFEVRAISRMSIDTLHGVSAGAGAWPHGSTQRA